MGHLRDPERTQDDEDPGEDDDQRALEVGDPAHQGGNGFGERGHASSVRTWIPSFLTRYQRLRSERRAAWRRAPARRSLLRRASRIEPALPVLERSSRVADQARRARRRRHSARSRRLLDRGRQVLGQDHAVGQHHGALEHVLELADVARASDSPTDSAAPPATPWPRAAPAAARPLEEVRDQVRQVVDTLAQRGQAQPHALQAVEEVGAELALGDQPIEVLVGGGDRRARPRRSAVPAHALDLALLERAQDLGLHARSGMSPISSRKSVPSRASSKRPGLARTAPVNAPRSWPNSSDSSRPSGIAAQFTGTNGPSLRALEPVDGAGQDFLAGAALALDEDRHVGGRRALAPCRARACTRPRSARSARRTPSPARPGAP